mmetsp:Transcript_45816/g.115366  ORF Transcript_45816/g.115366 Transcript_45816/m.115366 type:complete len:209 (+) Transcript_45816:2926-3552(+)
MPRPAFVDGLQAVKLHVDLQGVVVHAFPVRVQHLLVLLGQGTDVPEGARHGGTPEDRLLLERIAQCPEHVPAVQRHRAPQELAVVCLSVFDVHLRLDAGKRGSVEGCHVRGKYFLPCFLEFGQVFFQDFFDRIILGGAGAAGEIVLHPAGQTNHHALEAVVLLAHLDARGAQNSIPILRHNFGGSALCFQRVAADHTSGRLRLCGHIV